jgi:hypothetical protein
MILSFYKWHRNKSINKKLMPGGPIGLPIVGYLPFLGSKPHCKFVQLSKKYGNVFKYNQ